jgi:adenylate cyclase class IV
VALKSPRVFVGNGVQTRVELEFEAKSYEDVSAALRAQGLIPVVVIEKERWEFAIAGARVAVDRLPFIGAFVEIEGRSGAEIDDLVRKLGLSSCERVSQNYTELLEGVSGLGPGMALIATFDAERRARRS